MNKLRGLTAVCALVLAALALASPQLRASTTFLDTFSNYPAQPAPFLSDSWFTTIHWRDFPDINGRPVQAHHGTDCNPYPMVHTVTTREEMIYYCRDHLMTSMDGGEYGLLYMTPHAMVDFSQGEAVVRWDMSTLRTSGRDWVDVWITPPDEYLHHPLEAHLPDANGPPRRAIQLRMEGIGSDGPRQGMFRVRVINDFQVSEVNTTYQTYDTVLTQSAVRRDTFELRISQTHIKFGMPAYNLWWADQDIHLDWNLGLVQFGHHSYNPFKDGNGDHPGSWHWDNVTIEPSRTFTIINGTSQAPITAQQTMWRPKHTVPAGSVLRFAAVDQGFGLDVSFDQGATWQMPTRLPQQGTANWQTTSYMLPIPAGTTSVQFRSRDVPGHPWRVEDPVIFHFGPVSGPTPTPSATPEPTPTPSATPEPTPTPSATPAPIYTDALAAGWDNWSWATVNLSTSSPVHSGSSAIAVTYTAAWQGLFLHRAAGALPTNGYSMLSFWVHGGSSGTRLLHIYAVRQDGTETARVAVDAPAGVWTNIAVPLSQIGNPATIVRVGIQDRSGGPQPVFFVDDLEIR